MALTRLDTGRHSAGAPGASLDRASERYSPSTRRAIANAEFAAGTPQ
jgi:hypothetical protein